MADPTVLPPQPPGQVLRQALRARQRRDIPTYPDFIEGVIRPHSVNLLAGASGSGKTSLVSSWIARFLTGRTIFGHATHCPPDKLGVIAADRGTDSYQSWFKQHQVTDVPFYNVCEDPEIVPERFIGTASQLAELLIQSIALLELGPRALIVVDPLAPFIAGDLSSYKPSMVALMRLRKVCEALDVTLLGNVHTAKETAEKTYKYPEERILGSMGLRGYSDAQMYLERPDHENDEKHHLFGWRPHNAPPEVFRLMMDQKTGVFSLDTEGTTEREQHKVYVCSLIPVDEEGMPTAEIKQAAMDHLRIKEPLAKKYLYELEDDGKIERVRHGFWRRTVVN